MGLFENFIKNEEETKNNNLRNHVSNKDSFKANFKYLDDLIHMGIKNIVLGSDIILEPHEKEEYYTGIEIDVDDLVIDGKDHVISGENLTRIFKINAKGVLLKNINFKNGFIDGDGGAIFIKEMSDCRFENCCFEDNSSGGNGGSFYTDGIVQINDSKFINNNSGGSAGALINFGELKLEESEFGNNKADGDGGAIFNAPAPDGRTPGILEIQDTNFIDNEGTVGGGIVNFGKLEIYDGCFKDNSSRDTAGAVFNRLGTLKIKRTNFIGNKSKLSAGSILNDNLVEIDNCNFKSNFSEKGGTINNQPNSVLNIIDSTFTGNSAEDYGGVVLNYGDLKVENSTFNENSVDGSNKGSVIYNLNEGTVDIRDSIFDNNRPGRQDEIICSQNDNKNILNCEFVGTIEDTAKDNELDQIYNRKERNFKFLDELIHSDVSQVDLDSDIIFEDENDYGKGIKIDVDEIIINGNDFCIDACKKVPIFHIDSKQVTFKNITFKNGFFKKRGGCIINKDAKLNFISCKFIGNSTFYDGGAIYNFNGELTFNNCLFENNSAKWYGGAIYNSKGSSKFISCEFNNNSSFKKGCDIWNDEEIEILESKFNNRTCIKNNSLIFNENKDSNLKLVDTPISMDNGQILHIEEGNCVLKSANFESSELNEDYLIYNSKGSLKIEKITMPKADRKTIFNNNVMSIRKADGLENQIEFGENAHIEYKSDEINDDFISFEELDQIIHSGESEIHLKQDILLNESEQDFYEGGIEINLDNLIIDGENHIIDANELSRIFHITGRNVTLKNIIFKNGKYWKSYLDVEKNGGGAIYALPESSLSICDCKFIDNSSRNSAGAIMNHGEIKQLNNTEFINNNSKIHGGAIFNKNHPLDITACNFKENTSAMDGASIYILSDLTLKDKCTFENNVSQDNGGAVFIEDSELFLLEDSHFYNNSSNGAGGAVYIKNCQSISLENMIFENNVSKGKGGSIYNRNINDISLKSCNFKKCSSNSEGGALFCFDVKSDINIDSCKFNDNDGFTGGAIYNLSSSGQIFSNLNIVNSNFENNIANVGGAITNGLRMVCKSSNFINNVTREESGDINNGGISDLSYCTFKNDNNDSILVYNIQSGDITIENCDVSGNYQHICINKGVINLKSNNNFEKDYSFINKDYGKINRD